MSIHYHSRLVSILLVVVSISITTLPVAAAPVAADGGSATLWDALQGVRDRLLTMVGTPSSADEGDIQVESGLEPRGDHPDDHLQADGPETGSGNGNGGEVGGIMDPNG